MTLSEFTEELEGTDFLECETAIFTVAHTPKGWAVILMGGVVNVSVVSPVLSNALLAAIQKMKEMV